MKVEMGRKLIINGDDFGQTHATNAAILRCFKEGILTSASVQAPCPWFAEAAHMTLEHDIPCGVHITLTCEYELYQYGPITRSPCLSRDEQGVCFVRSLADIGPGHEDSVEAEMRAQIERVLTAGVEPTHIDIHMATFAEWVQDFPGLVNELYKTYGIPFRDVTPYQEKIVRTLGSPHELIIDWFFALVSTPPLERALDHFGCTLDSMPEGVAYAWTHPGVACSELDGVCSLSPVVNTWRVHDTNLLCAPEARALIEKHGIDLISCRDVKLNGLAD